MTRVAVMVIHGLGMQKEDYADKLIACLSKEMERVMVLPGAAKQMLDIEPVFWADVFEEREEALFQQLVRSPGLHYQALRRFVIHYLADAVAYQPVENQGHHYDAVHRTLNQAMHVLAQRNGPEAPLCVVAHSLGAVIASNFFYDLQYPSSNRIPEIVDVNSALERGDTLTNFYSFGTTLPLWSLRYDNFSRPIRVPAPQATHYFPHLEGEWVNFYESNDILGYPLRPIDPAYAAAVKEDIEVRVGGPATSWNPLSHGGYFTSEHMNRRIAQGLARTWTWVNRSR
ncbi:chemotaxis protein [Paenibacillus polysaccharolyticus]|uniref:Chemotaxis protein n=1 Tax=Paenibacillus cucumis (ex Kampfer et al. 2016) TaxID=1776858 RepID=A0ABS7KMP4_9BACL|nr:MULTISPECIES: chemotaxis protein [Paenibacillus]MBY0205231.1 chemotaxis protein [Paenibacillus cucumis (ex Kampfer et al. 2016)]MCP1134253.1 chemotaxis protein [Paenibacillus polysaccharolyticus]